MKKYLLLFLIWLIAVPVMAGPQGTSGVTTTTLFDEIRYRIGAIDPSGTTDEAFSDTYFLQLLNDGMLDIAKKTKCLQEIETVTMVSGQTEYSLSTGYYTIEGAIFVKSSGDYVGLKKGNIWSVGRDKQSIKPSTQRQPEYWYEFDGRIGIYPALSSVTGEVTHVFMSILPADIELGDAVTIPTVYENALKLYIIKEAMAKDKQFALAAVKEQEYIAELALDRPINEPFIKPDELIE